MGWIQTGFLFTLGAIAIPLLIHLLNRRQIRRLELGTMRFLQEVIHDSASRRRIRRWFLLATRVALVILLSLLFARPFVPDSAVRDGERLRLVLIDRSAGMTMPGQSGRIIDDAISAAAAAVERAGSDTQVQWAWFDSYVEPLAEGTGRPSPPRLLAGHTDYTAALGWARDWFSSRQSSDTELIIATDLQQSGMTGQRLLGDEIRFPADIPVRIIDVGRAAVDNLAILHVDPGAPQQPAGRSVVMTTTLFKYGALSAEQVPITASAASEHRTVKLKKIVDVAPEQAEEVTFDFGKLEAGTWRITVDIDVNDDLAADNRRVTAVKVADPIDVWVIDPTDDAVVSLPASYYLVAALAQGVSVQRSSEESAGAADVAALDVGELSAATQRFKRFRPRVLDLDASQSQRFSNAQVPLVVVADAGLIPRRLIDQLTSYVESGGKLLVFTGEPISQAAAQYWDTMRLSPGRLARTESSGAMPFRIVSISARGSMLQPFYDPQHGDLGRLAFNSLTAAEVDTGTSVHAWFDQQRPAITEHPLGDGRVVWFLSSADDRGGNWTASPLYLPLVHQMASDLLGLTGEGSVRFRSVGDADVNPSTDSDAVTVSGQSMSRVLHFDQPGFQQREDGALYVINTSPKESDPARMDDGRFVQHFGLTAAGVEEAVATASVVAPQRRELWPWLAAALVVLLFVEFCLANRTPA